MPVASWYDEEVASALKVWQSLRRRRKRHEHLRADCQRARRTYEKLRAYKLRIWEHQWRRFWIDVAKCDHTTVWKVIRQMSGKKNLECKCPEPVQRAHYRKIGELKTNADFDWARAAEAEAWIHDFLAAGRGLNGAEFTEAEVTSAFENLKQCSSVIDGLSKNICFLFCKH